VILALQCLPFVLLVLLLASGRVAPAWAALAALVAALPAVWLAVPDMPGFLASAAARGAWLAAMPIAVVAAGLVFHGAVGNPRADAERASREKIFAVAFLLGPFLESVTGFAVGVVFALASLRRMGLAGPAMVAVGLYALLLIPWGGLGPGTFLGAALAGVPVAALARHNAWLSAAWLFPMLLVFRRLAARLGLPADARTQVSEALWVAALGLLLVLANHAMPVELGGIASTGPLLLLRHRDRLMDRAAWRAAAPYIALTAALLGTHLLPGLGPWMTGMALRPFPDLPGLPLNHAALVLGAVALLLLALRPDRGAVLLAALGRARRPAIAMLLFVVLARVLAGSGIAGALAARLAAASGGLAPFTAPVLGALAGFFVGTNVGSNSVTMPLVAALSAGTSLPPALLPAVQNFTGSALCLISPPVLALALGISGERARPAEIWRVLAPGPLAAVLVAWVAIALATPA
jgi:lactate permease